MSAALLPWLASPAVAASAWLARGGFVLAFTFAAVFTGAPLLHLSDLGKSQAGPPKVPRGPTRR